MRQRGPIIAAAVAAALAIIAVVVFVLPKMGQVSDSKKQLEQAQMQEDSLRAQLQSLQDAEASAPQTKQQIQELDNQVPPTADLPALIRLLREAADASAVDFFTVTPGTPTADTSGTFSIIPSSVTVTGKYFSLDEFLFRLETLPRAAKVMDLNITPMGETTGGSTGGTPTLTMTLSVEFYTTDSSAGPGSNPGPSTGTGAPTGGGTTPTPAASPTLPAT